METINPNPNMNTNISILMRPKTYYSNFRNTNLLPLTPIFKLVEEEYNAYLSNPNSEDLSLKDIINIDFGLFLNSTNGNYNGSNIKNNSNFNLEKLLCYLIYTKSSSLLVKKENDLYELTISELKGQIGKDIVRLDVFINNIKENFKIMNGGNPNPETPSGISSLPDDIKLDAITKLNNNEDISYDKITDKYMEFLIGKEDNDFINYNILNEIGILSCQNIFNFIVQLLQIQIKQSTQNTLKNDYLLVSPTTQKDSNDIPTVSKNKELRIEINNNKIVSIFFDSYLFTSSDFISVGRITFTMSFDLINNSFQFDTLNISYNLENILPAKPKYTIGQTAQYYGLTKPSRYIKKHLLTRRGGKVRKTKKDKTKKAKKDKTKKDKTKKAKKKKAKKSKKLN
jgi:hypothetical protein